MGYMKYIEQVKNTRESVKEYNKSFDELKELVITKAFYQAIGPSSGNKLFRVTRQIATEQGFITIEFQLLADPEEVWYTLGSFRLNDECDKLEVYYKDTHNFTESEIDSVVDYLEKVIKEA